MIQGYGVLFVSLFKCPCETFTPTSIVFPYHLNHVCHQSGRNVSTPKVGLAPITKSSSQEIQITNPFRKHVDYVKARAAGIIAGSLSLWLPRWRGKCEAMRSITDYVLLSSRLKRKQYVRSPWVRCYIRFHKVCFVSQPPLVKQNMKQAIKWVSFQSTHAIRY